MHDLVMVSLASPAYAKLQARLVQKTREGGAISLHDAWSAEDFFYTADCRQAIADHPVIFNTKQGLGLYAWVPFLVLFTMQTHPLTDVLYMDADEWIEPVHARAHKDAIQATLREKPVAAFSFAFGYKQSQWTTRDCFVAMGCDTPRFHNLPHLHAGQVAFRNSPEGRAVVKDWCEYCLNERAIGAVRNFLPNLPDFVEHRWNQSILTNLLAMHGITPTDGLEQYRSYSKEP